MAAYSSPTIGNTQPEFRRIRYGLRLLLLLTFLAATGIGGVAMAVEPSSRQDAAVRQLEAAGFTILYDKKPAASGNVWFAQAGYGIGARTIITDDTFSAFDSLPTLREVDLSGTRITDAGLQHLKGLTSLEKLYLGGTHIGDAGLARLAHLTQLKELYLFSTEITDKGMASLARLRNLKRLSLDGCAVGSAGIQHLSEMNRLELLSLNNTRVDDDGLAHLTGLKAITLLSLRNTHISDRGTQQLAKMNSLQCLSLIGTAITDAGLPHLGRLTNLGQLGLSDTKITDAGLLRLTPLTNLKWLYVTGTDVTCDGALALQDALPLCYVECPVAAGTGKGRVASQRTGAKLAERLTLDRVNPAIAVLIQKAKRPLAPVRPPDPSATHIELSRGFPGLKNVSSVLTTSGIGTYGGKPWPPIHCFTVTEKATGKSMKWYVQGACTADHFLTRSAIGWDGDYIPGVFLSTGKDNSDQPTGPSATRRTATAGHEDTQTACIRVRFAGDSDIRLIFIAYDAQGNQLPALPW